MKTFKHKGILYNIIKLVNPETNVVTLSLDAPFGPVISGKTESEAIKKFKEAMRAFDVVNTILKYHQNN